MKKPALNRIYTSTDRALSLESRVDNSDWFHCNWTIRPKIKTTEFKRNVKYYTNYIDTLNNWETISLFQFVAMERRGKY